MKASALFKKAAKKTSTKKDTTPEFIDSTLAGSIKLFNEAKKMEKKAKAQIMLAEASILPRAAEERQQLCESERVYHSSIKACSDEGKVTVSFANKYSKIPTEKEGELRVIFADQYDRYFEEKTLATLTPKALNDESFIETIIEAIGADRFALYFKVEQFIAPKEEYHKNRAQDSKLQVLHEKANKAGLVSPNKPSVKAG